MMIFFHFSKVRRFFSLKEAILDPKCKTKKLNIALNFHYQKSLHLYDVPVRRNSIFRAEGRKFSMSVLWRKNLTISIFFIFDLLHLILTQVYPIGWKRRIFHFHPTSVWSYRICKFWCWVRIKYVNLQKCPPIVHTSIFFNWFKDNLPRKKNFFVPFHPKLRLQTIWREARILIVLNK